VSKLVIFGGNGFIGSALRALLDRQEIAYAAPTSRELDLMDDSVHNGIREIVEDGDTVVMIAAYTREHGNACNLTDLNIRMAANVLRAVKIRDIPHCVYVSSDTMSAPTACMAKSRKSLLNPHLCVRIPSTATCMSCASYSSRSVSRITS
jgi:nucleoside-diphosphate-sugar epimerase